MLIRLAFLLSLAAVPAVGQADELDDLLGCNAEALGGAAAFEAIDNLRVELSTISASNSISASRRSR
jgi:hypothetical protein